MLQEPTAGQHHYSSVQSARLASIFPPKSLKQKLGEKDGGLSKRRSRTEKRSTRMPGITCSRRKESFPQRSYCELPGCHLWGGGVSLEPAVFNAKTPGFSKEWRIFLLGVFWEFPSASILHPLTLRKDRAPGASCESQGKLLPDAWLPQSPPSAHPPRCKEDAADPFQPQVPNSRDSVCAT